MKYDFICQMHFTPKVHCCFFAPMAAQRVPMICFQYTVVGLSPEKDEIQPFSRRLRLVFKGFGGSSPTTAG